MHILANPGFPYTWRAWPLLEWFTIRGRLVRRARAFARAHRFIFPRPDFVNYKDTEGCWEIWFEENLNPPGSEGMVAIDPTPYVRVRVDPRTGFMSADCLSPPGWK